jgi:hypothetical protein
VALRNRASRCSGGAGQTPGGRAQGERNRRQDFRLAGADPWFWRYQGGLLHGLPLPSVKSLSKVLHNSIASFLLGA